MSPLDGSVTFLPFSSFFLEGENAGLLKQTKEPSYLIDKDLLEDLRRGRHVLQERGVFGRAEQR